MERDEERGRRPSRDEYGCILYVYYKIQIKVVQLSDRLLLLKTVKTARKTVQPFSQTESHLFREIETVRA